MARKAERILRAKKSRRGRPSKASQQQLIEQDGAPVALEFQLRPLRTPVDASFRPYYERVLKGDLAAVAVYFDANGVRTGLDASFFELVGRLLPLRCYRGVRAILSIVEGLSNWPSNRESYEYWYQRLLPLCRLARQFIEEAHASSPDANRDKLWHDYMYQPLPTARYVRLAGQEDEERLQREANERDQGRRRLAVEVLRTWAKSHTKDSVRSRLSAPGCQGKDLESLVERNFHLANVQKFSPFGFVTREIFDDLALTRVEAGKRHFTRTPATIARRFACKIVRVSESWASRKNVRN
jgi:hypothetical protein